MGQLFFELPNVELSVFGDSNALKIFFFGGDASAFTSISSLCCAMIGQSRKNMTKAVNS